MKKIRRFFSFVAKAIGSSPPPHDGANHSALDLDARADGVEPSEEVDVPASSTGIAARRRRRRRRRQRAPAATAADPDPKNATADQERSENLNATAPDPKNDDPYTAIDYCAKDTEVDCSVKKPDEADSSTGHGPKNATGVNLPDEALLDATPPTTPSPPKSFGPSAGYHDARTDGVDPSEVTAAASSTGPAARRRRKRNNRRERERAATGQEPSARLAKATASDQEPLHPTGIVLDDRAPLDAPPVGNHDDVALSATTSTTEDWNLVVRKKKRATPPPALPRPDLASVPAVPPRCARLPNPDFVPVHRIPAAAPVGRHCLAALPGLLDDLQGEESFFYGLFDQPVDECRARHLRYKEACSSLKSNLTYCLACFLRDEKEDRVEIKNKIDEVEKHMRRYHKGGSTKCDKSGCYAMATTAQDIRLHYLYAH